MIKPVVTAEGFEMKSKFILISFCGVTLDRLLSVNLMFETQGDLIKHYLFFCST